VQKWWDNVPGTFTSLVDETELATQAAQWGADQELEACGRWLEDQLCMPPDARADVITQLNGSRRPKPPSLKEQALLIIDTAVNDYRMSSDAASIIRRALKALDD
jgi:hypothetical protein